MKKDFLIFLFLITAISTHSQIYNGSIIRVIDGDTFVFQTQDGSFIVRMYGTDAPERDQPFSKESAEFLSKYLHKDAIFKANGTDRYGRRLGILYVDEQDINLLSIQSGYSWHFKRYSKDQEYADAEDYARKYNLGLWNLKNSVPPWDWRKD